MSHEEAHGQVATFSPEEVAALRADDKQAARQVLLLMIGVFLIGVVLYLFVAVTL
jgi:hypothetical protein